MRLIAALLCSVFIVTAAGSTLSAQGDGQAVRTVYFLAADGKGVPVLDLTAADFAVKEGGRVREVVRLEPAMEPMQVAIVVDDNGRGFFQPAVFQLVSKLQGRAEFTIFTVNGSPTRLTDYTSDGNALRGALDRLGVRAGAPGDGQVLEALQAIAQGFRQRKAARPVIAVFTVSGGSTSVPSRNVLDLLRTTGALLHVVGTKLARNIPPPLTGRTDAADFEVSRAFDDGARQSGGRVQEFVDARGIDQAVARMTDELLNLYAISYALPAGTKPDERFEIEVKRRGVSLRAPTRIPIN